MGKKNKTNFEVGETVAKNQTEFIELLRKHPLLQSCSLKQLTEKTGSESGNGRLVWARNPGSVYWPALIATFEDKPEVKTDAPSENEPVVAPEFYRSVMFLESAFRFSLLGWKDLILLDEEQVDLQRDLIVKFNRFIIKKSWREEKPFKEAVDLLLEFTQLPVPARQSHAFHLSLKKKEAKPKRVSVKLATESEGQSDVVPVTSCTNSTVSLPKRRDSERYTFRQILPSRDSSPGSTPSASVVALSTSRSNSPSSEGQSSKLGEIETLSDLSRKHRKRPKVGGQELKAYAENRFMCIDKAYRFEKNDVMKCATCMEDIVSGQTTICHDLPHHRTCLKKSTLVGKDGSTHVYYKCRDCLDSLCFLCKQKKCKDEDQVPVKCSKCDLKFHRLCLEAWPQAVIQGSNGPITCPTHFCHTCFGEQRVYNKQRNFKVFSGNKFRCLQCLSTYHKPYCVPAGCGENISGNNFIVCPRHTLPKLPNKQNRFGCLGCGLVLKRKDEEIIECTLCLQNFHASCIGYSEKHKIDGLSVETFGRDYKCRSCTMGLFPIYGQVVWFQQKPHSFWPARTLFPKEDTGRSEYYKGKLPGEYSIKYFGPVPSFYDKSSRTFPIHLTTVKLFTAMGIYHENDKIKSSYDEAEFFHQLVEQFRDEYLPEPIPFYKRIERNIYRNYNAPTKKKSENTGPCLCHLREDEKACTISSGCHNRDTAVECNEYNCVSGDRCHNRMFTQKGKETENTEQFLCRNKGWAVRAAKDFGDGDFITEYCGEIINSAEMQYRANKKSEEDPLYLLEIDKHTFIDAEYCGNVSRLINHSCEPNCRTEKYTSADGRPVVGVFAQASIIAGEELTFDYAYGTESAAPFRCHCGAENCRGYIGKTPPDDFTLEVFNPDDDTHDKQCFKCTFGGYVLCCSFEGCCKVYHKTCANVSREPEGDWFCPDHVIVSGTKRKAVKGTGSESLAKRQKPVLLKRNRISPKTVTAKNLKKSPIQKPVVEDANQDSMVDSDLEVIVQHGPKPWLTIPFGGLDGIEMLHAPKLTPILPRLNSRRSNGILCQKKVYNDVQLEKNHEKNLIIMDMPTLCEMVKTYRDMNCDKRNATDLLWKAFHKKSIRDRLNIVKEILESYVGIIVQFSDNGVMEDVTAPVNKRLDPHWAELLAFDFVNFDSVRFEELMSSLAKIEGEKVVRGYEAQLQSIMDDFKAHRKPANLQPQTDEEFKHHWEIDVRYSRYCASQLIEPLDSLPTCVPDMVSMRRRSHKIINFEMTQPRASC